MYYVQYKAVGVGGNDQWVIDKELDSLEAALAYAIAEARNTHMCPT
jgi:hypothetical protein